MSERNSKQAGEHKVPPGTWFCKVCNRVAEIESVEKGNGTYKFIALCGHSVDLTVNGVQKFPKTELEFVTYREQLELAKGIILSIIDGCYADERNTTNDVITQNLEEAVAKIVGLEIPDVRGVIYKGIEDKWLKISQPEIKERVTTFKDLFGVEFIPDKAGDENNAEV